METLNDDTKQTYTLIAEPRGDAYPRLLAWLFANSASLTVVAREDLGFVIAESKLIAEASPWELERISTDEWPGTKIFRSETTVIRYRADQDLLPLIQRAATGIYQWTSELPEDIAFYRADGSVLFGSIAHERDCFLTLTSVEYSDLTTSVPDIARLLIVSTENDMLWWLQEWYADQCDTEWELTHGIAIGTLDGSGWAVTIDLRETRWEHDVYEGVRIDRSDENWVSTYVEDSTFRIDCGARNLAEGIVLLREWIESTDKYRS